MADIGKYHCPHCEIVLSKKSYDAHKRLYYDEDASQWIKKRRFTTKDEHTLLSETEHAIEQFDFDANFDWQSDLQNPSNDSEHELPPPYIDLSNMEKVDDHQHGEYNCWLQIAHCSLVLGC